MDLSKHVLKSLTDDTWIKEYAASMGEDKLYNYKNEVYKLLFNLKVGQSLSIIKWVKPENFDLFIKIACCFMSETNQCYFFYDNYTTIKHRFDAQQMARTFEFFERKRRENDNGADGAETELHAIRTSLVSAPQAAV